MKTKRILSIAMTLLLTFSVAACTKPTQIQVDPDPEPVVSQPGDPEPEPSGETGKKEFNNPEGPVVIFEDNFDD